MRALAPVVACLLLLPPGPPPVAPPVPPETSHEARPETFAPEAVAEALSEPEPVREARGTLVQPERPVGRSLGAFRVTAYCISGVTRSGTHTRSGVVATDRSVIPQWSRLRIEGLPGEYVSEDTGSGVIGRHIDVYMPSCRDAINWGVRTKAVELR